MSVVITIPTYNRARLLRRAIASVYSQTSREWRLAVFDDGSTDWTDRWAGESAAGSFEYFRRNENKGLVYTFNEMLDWVLGTDAEYWSWLASDDKLLPEFVEAHLSTIRAADCDVTWSNFFTLREGTTRRVYVDMAMDPAAIATTMKQRVCVSLASICVRVDALREVRDRYGLFCSRAFKHMNDWDFLLKLVSVTEDFFHIPTALSVYHIHKDMGSAGVYYGETSSEIARQFLQERAEMRAR